MSGRWNWLWNAALVTMVAVGAPATAVEGLGHASLDRPLCWQATEGLSGAVMRVADQGDGQVEMVDIGQRKAVRNRGQGSSYIYFDLLPGWTSDRAYVVVEFRDEGLGILGLEYDSQQGAGAPLMASYQAAENSSGAMLLNTRSWRKAVFELARPQFRNRQNHHSDLRLTTHGRIAVASVTILDGPLPGEQMRQIQSAGSLEKLSPIVKVGPGVESTIGGYDNFDTTQTAAWKASLLQSLAVLRALGATSHETYVIWRCCQKEEGTWDFSHYDACVEAHQKVGIKWVPFVILGPVYTLPDWFYKSSERLGYRCLEHNQASDIQSLWDPNLATRVEAFLAAFAKQYRDRGVIESVLLGITGNYGEAIYPATGNDWTASIHGNYHGHSGMWCGDPYAIRDYQRWLKARYGRIDRLNAAWASNHADFPEIHPIKDEKAASTRAWLDTVDWYRDAMNRWVDLWMRIAAREMPGLPIYLCTGGHAPPEHGSEFGIQSKLAAKHGGGVRITNESSDYAANFAVTRWVGSACRFYGTFFGYEPAGVVDHKGVVARIFNAASSGAKQLHHYPDNLLADIKATDNWQKYGSLMRLRKPKIDVAVWYPNRMVDLRRGDVWHRLREMREVCDYDIVDDQMIRDGALDRYRILVCISDGPYERDILNRVQNWISPDKSLYLPVAEGLAIQSTEGDRQTAAAWKGRPGVHLIHADPKTEPFYAALRKELSGRGVYVTGLRGVYAAAFEDGSMLLLNMTDAVQTLRAKGRSVTLPAVSIVEVP